MDEIVDETKGKIRMLRSPWINNPMNYGRDHKLDFYSN